MAPYEVDETSASNRLLLKRPGLTCIIRLPITALLLNIILLVFVGVPPAASGEAPSGRRRRLVGVGHWFGVEGGAGAAASFAVADRIVAGVLRLPRGAVGFLTVKKVRAVNWRVFSLRVSLSEAHPRRRTPVATSSEVAELQKGEDLAELC